MTNRQDEGVITNTHASGNPEAKVHILYKKLGQTPLEALEEYRRESIELAGQPLTYAGRLDPMAEGLLLVISGVAVNEKEKYTNLPKTYVSKILWGFETDTLDILGLISPRGCLGQEIVPEIEEVKKYLENMVGKFDQKYPAYSSKPVLGKPLFKWAREGRLLEIEIPTHEVEIFSAQHISREEISGDVLLNEIISKINLVSGDFRQEEIKKEWQHRLDKTPPRVTLGEKFIVDNIELNVGSGFYVRQFVSDLAENFNTKAVTYHILRTKVGDFIIWSSNNTTFGSLS